MYIDQLDDIVNECNNTYLITFKTKPADVNLSKYIDFETEKNNKNPEFDISDNVRIANL